MKIYALALAVFLTACNDTVNNNVQCSLPKQAEPDPVAATTVEPAVAQQAQQSPVDASKRQWVNTVLTNIDNGRLNPHYVAVLALTYMSDEEIEDMCRTGLKDCKGDDPVDTVDAQQ